MLRQTLSIMMVLLGVLGHCAVIAMASNSSEQQEAVKLILDVTTRRSIGGISELNRLKYFNLCDDGLNFYDHVPSRDAGDALLDELNISFGRMIGLTGRIARSVTEDPDRPGYADTKSIKEQATRLKNSMSDAIRAKVPQLDVIEHGRRLSWPRFMMKEGELEQVDLPVNQEAAAEFIALCFKACFADWNRPRYLEFVNEYPFPDATDEQMDAFCEMHNAMAKAVHRILPDTLVGGPCYWYGNFHENGFKDWDYTMKRYMDIAHGDTDFYSFHNYDFSNNGKRNISSGTRTEAILDLVENYSLNSHGHIKPFASSECGATGVDHWWYFTGNQNLIEVDGSKVVEGVKVISFAELTWQHIRALNSQMMGYMNRPDRILKIVPFTLADVAGWTTKAHWTLFARENFDREGRLLPTDHFKFYEFWKDVKGSRVSLQSNNPDIQVQAFVDHETIYICLNNLSELPGTLNLQTVLDTHNRINKLTKRSVFFDGVGAVLQDRSIRPEQLESFPIKGDESIILTMVLNDAPIQSRTISESFHYGDRTVVPITGKTETFNIKIPTTQVAHAQLRIGISRDIHASVVPAVTFNGKELAVHLEQSYDKQVTNAQKDSGWGIRVIPIAPSLLRKKNIVNVGFPDEGGIISSVVMMMGAFANHH